MNKESLSGSRLLSRLQQSHLLPLIIGVILLLSMPSANSSGWVEYQSQHFILYSDAKPSQAKQYLSHAEQFRQVVSRFSQVSPNAKLQLVMYNSNAQFRSLVEERVSGKLLIGFLIFTANKDKWQMDAVPREQLINYLYTQYHLQRSNAYYPFWFRAMLAELLSVTKIKDSQAIIGAYNQLYSWNDIKLTDIATLIKLRHTGDLTTEINQSLWFFGHFLLLGELAGGPGYVTQLVNFLELSKAKQNTETIFADAFGKTPQVMDVELKAYSKQTLKGVLLPLQPYVGDITEQALSQDRTYFLLGKIAFLNDSPQLALEYLQKIPASAAEYKLAQHYMQRITEKQE